VKKNDQKNTVTIMSQMSHAVRLRIFIKIRRLPGASLAYLLAENNEKENENAKKNSS
jgi:hypothetical protein